MSSASPRVSIIIPVFNPGALLERSLASVLSQSEKDYECIIVDDGSTEDISGLAGLSDERVRIIRQPNAGVSVARNVGAQSARSPLLAFLDQDDEWAPDKLTQQLAAVTTHPMACLWATGFEWVLPSGSQVQPSGRVTYEGLLSDQHLCLSSVLVTQERYAEAGGHDPLLTQMQDWDLFLRLTMLRGDPHVVDAPLVRYHVHGGNASADYPTAARERLRVLDDHAARAHRSQDLAVLLAVQRGRARTRELYAYQAVDGARASLARHDVKAALRHALRSVTYDPRVFAGSVGEAARKRLSRRGTARTQRPESQTST